MNRGHTILLIQKNPNPASRKYLDYETVPDAMNGIQLQNYRFFSSADDEIFLFFFSFFV
jgi:hypothetical protein